MENSKVQIANTSDLVSAKTKEIVSLWMGLDTVVLNLDQALSQRTLGKIQNAAGQCGIRVLMIDADEFKAFEVEMEARMDAAIAANPGYTDLDDLQIDYWDCIIKAVPEIEDYKHRMFTPDSEKPPVNPIELVSNNPNGGGEVRRMFTQHDVDRAIEAATAPLYETLKRFETLFDQMNAEAERQKLDQAAKHEPPQPDDILPTPVVDETYGLRARHAAIVTERSEVHDKWMKALRERDKDAQKMYRERFDALSDERKKIEADPTFRTQCADIIHAGADSTRKYGHKTVDAVADVMHKAVDITANSMDKVGNMVDKKDRLTTEATIVNKPTTN